MRNYYENTKIRARLNYEKESRRTTWVYRNGIVTI